MVSGFAGPTPSGAGDCQPAYLSRDTGNKPVMELVFSSRVRIR